MKIWSYLVLQIPNGSFKCKIPNDFFITVYIRVTMTMAEIDNDSLLVSFLLKSGLQFNFKQANYLSKSKMYLFISTNIYILTNFQ